MTCITFSPCGSNHASLALICVLSFILSSSTHAFSILQIQPANYSIETIVNWNQSGGIMNLTGSRSTMILLDLNSLIQPTLQHQDMRKLIKLNAQFYITKFPAKGELYQAFRPTPCINGTSLGYPLSCSFCCGLEFSTSLYNIPGVPQDELSFQEHLISVPHCCARLSDAGNRIFNVGDRIHAAPSKVTITESGFLWFLPNASETGSPYTQFQFRVEFWRADAPPLSPATTTDSGCGQDRKNCLVDPLWCINNTDYASKLKVDGSCCGRCTLNNTNFSVNIDVTATQQYPQVGFGGHMIAFDGGDDFMVTDFSRMPSYEFGLQFWFQQSKLSPGQTILTWWTDSRGREFEIADSSNIFFYHMNNRSQSTGVGLNDGIWHHIGFSFRLVCPDSIKIAGAQYCIEPFCNVEFDCLHFEIALIVDGQYRTEAYLPPFLPSSQGKLIWGQRVLKNYLSSENVFKTNLFQRLQDQANVITSNIGVEFTDRELQLIYSRIRSGYLNDTMLFQNLISVDKTGWVLTEDEPWRNPHFKYCEAVGGDFDPYAALSANIDEIRLYSYYRRFSDVILDMQFALSGDGFYTYSNPEGNVSLILYLNFDLNHADMKARSRDLIQAWPLDIEDQATPSVDLSIAPSVTTLGSSVFTWAPLQIPSTAPLRGSRTIQISIPNNEEPIPINLIDIAVQEDRSQYMLYSRIDVGPLFGDLRAAADDCDSITTVESGGSSDSAISFRSEPACMGGILDIFLVGGISASTLTSNCSVGDKITAVDGYGSGFLADISVVSPVGAIQGLIVLHFGSGYDWVNSSRTDLIVGNGTCACGGKPGNVRGNMRPCMRALTGPGKADTSGKDFAGVDLSGTVVTYNYGPTSCNLGLCPAVKPRPCAWACYRTLGWMTDLVITPTDATQYNKFTAGPYSEYDQSTKQFIRGFEPVYWSNQRHTVWYVPTTFGGSDTQNDQILVRKFNSFPMLEIFAKDLIPPPPKPHAWIQIVREKLTIALNTSITWEANSAMVIQLQFMDFDRGTNILNSPSQIFVDLPSRGFLYQAIQMDRSDPNFDRDCICMNAPRFPLLQRKPDVFYYPKNSSLPGSVQCDVSKIGNYCMKQGLPVVSNDTEVSQFQDTIFIPGFQHARHGYHVVYYMGDDQSGSADFNWKIKHPQGQVQNASVHIEVRRSNSPPVVLNRSFATIEDTALEVSLEAMDLDDYQKPTMFITQYPSHGELYQCKNTSQNSSCEVGERISWYNDSMGQWAVVEIDPMGAVDDATSKVWQLIHPQNSTFDSDGNVRVNSNATQILYGGYGFTSWDFDPELPQNFRRMCGSRGTVAAKITVQQPVFVTDIEIFSSLRFDTPFRLLAKTPHPLTTVANDYNLQADGGLGSFPVATSSVSVPMDSSQDMFESSTIASQYVIDCGIESILQDMSVCQGLWNDSKLSKAMYREFTANEEFEWIELYRGLPQSAQASKDRISPIFAPGEYHTSEYRVEACGQNGRFFGRPQDPFLKDSLIRITGSPTLRPKGIVYSGSYRFIYVPHHNWNGEDTFAYSVLDRAGLANRSSPRFSMGRAWSPPAFVDIIIYPKEDIPEGTGTVLSMAYSDGIETVLVPVEGFQVGLSGVSPPITIFQVQIVDVPALGELLDLDGLPLTLKSVTNAVRYRPPAGACGSPFASFTYFLQNDTSGQGLISQHFSATVGIGCQAGSVCNTLSSLCEACPSGSFGRGSGASNSCFLCGPGKFQDKSSATTCESCQPGKYVSNAGATSCLLCSAGTISTKQGESGCIPCQGGMFAPLEGSTGCSECGQGAYTQTAGSTSCTDCPNNTWTRTRTAAALSECECVAGFYVLGSSGMPCLPCPYGAYCHGRTLLPVPKTGYWTSQALWTDPVPVERGDYRWMPLNASGVAVFIPCSYRYIRGACIGYPDVDVQEEEEICQYRNSHVHQGPSSLDSITSEGIDIQIKVCTLLLPDEVPEVGPNTALRPWEARQNYSANYYCAEGYNDFICSKCANGFTRNLAGFCSKCSILFTVPFIDLCYFVGVAGIHVIAWFLVFVAASYRARSFHLLITHLQLLAVLGRLAVPWPQVAQGPLNVCAWFNFNFDGLNWNCLNLNMEISTTRWFLDIVAPWIVVTGTAGYFFWTLRNARSAARIAKNQAAERAQRDSKERSLKASMNSSRGSTTNLIDSIGNMTETRSNESQSARVLVRGSAIMRQDDASENSSDSGNSIDSSLSAVSKNSAISHRKSNRKVRATKDRDTIAPLSSKEIRKIEDSAIGYVVLGLNTFYVMAIMSIFVPLTCSEVTASFMYLDWNPRFKCNTSEHIQMQLLAAALAVLWIFAIPSILIYILWKAWHMELIRDHVFSNRFGWLIEPYEIKYCWWEIAVLVRKLIVVAGQGLFAHNGYLQLVTISSYSALHLCLTFYCQPHVHRRHTILDMWLQSQFLFLSVYAMANIVGKDGLRVVNILFGLFNENVREGILPPYPDMESIADRYINGSTFLNFLFIVLMLCSTIIAIFMVAFDVYELRPKAPFWAPFLYNAISGLPLHQWKHDSSRVLGAIDNIIGQVRDRRKRIPPSRPPSRWAHRVMEQRGEAKAEDFWDSKSLNEMIEDVVAATQEQEWPRTKSSVLDYIRSLDRRIFAAEAFYSKSKNLAPLERERNNAKKILLKYEQKDAEDVFKKLYNQTGYNERLLAEIGEFKRREQHFRVLIAGKEEEMRYIDLEYEEQQRRIVEAEKWRLAYTDERKHSQELMKKVKQARDAGVLYYLEESSSSEDERQIDDYLKQRVDEYIDRKTAKDMMDDGKMQTIPKL